MCGISGIWYFNPNQLVEPNKLEQMTAQLVHRGPDDAGLYCEGSIGFGFRRLSLIDRAANRQPLANEDRQLWLVCNGEIYNYQMLRHRLSAHTFQTNGDVETILHLYEERGWRCLEDLRGMFAFALWDNRRQELLLAVDRFGEKPLYYSLDDERIVLGSELKAVCACLDQPTKLDLEALDEYFACGCIGAPRTIYQSIRKLMPGQCMVVHPDGTTQFRTYWQPSFAEPAGWDQRPTHELAFELSDLLSEAVRLRMTSDEPVGAFLSGGIDSSSVVALMKQCSSTPIKAFSVGFAEPAFDERSYAQTMADYCGVELIHEVVSPTSLDVLPDLVRQLDEPFADSSVIPTYLVSKLARQQVKTVLSGDGGDEIFAGYQHYLYAYRQSLVQSLLPVRWRSQAASTAHWLPSAVKIKPYLAVVDQDPRCWKSKTEFFDSDRRKLLLGGVQPCEINETRMANLFQEAAQLDGVSRLQRYDLLTYLPNDILVKVDRASMYASLEVRAPLLDHKLFEFMARIPPRQRANVFRGKLLLKRALGSRLPPMIRKRRKRGFSIPQSEWLCHSSLVRAVLVDSPSVSPLIDYAYVRRLWTEHLTGRADHKDRLWAVLCFLLWVQNVS